MLICKKCNLEKNFSDFYKENKTKLGYRKICKNCYSN